MYGGLLVTHPMANEEMGGDALGGILYPMESKLVVSNVNESTEH